MDTQVDLYNIICHSIASFERGLQKAIGPSELGTPCDRRLAFKLAQTPEAQQRDARPAWRPAVGTMVHTGLASFCQMANDAEMHYTDSGGNCKVPWCDFLSDLAHNNGYGTGPGTAHLDRWVIEQRTECGTINGEVISGTADIYDRATQTLVDWKIPGPTAIKKYRRDRHPGKKYQRQVHIYARGFSRKMGLPVTDVAIYFLPMNGELDKDSYYWSESYSPNIANAAFTRARAIDIGVNEQNDTPASYERTEDNCKNCPWFDPSAIEGVTLDACKGADSMYSRTGDDFSDLI